MDMKKHITTVTLNPCIDRTITIEDFKIGATNYVIESREEVAGKGINVALALQHLEVPVKSIGFGFISDYDKMISLFRKEQLSYELIKTMGTLRVNLKVFSKKTKQMTECNEKGYLTEQTDLARFYQLLEEELLYTRILVVDGSVPEHVKDDCYAKMIRMASDHNIPTILDASGALLLNGIKENPFLIKPNKDEFIKTFACEEKDIEKKAVELVKNGIAYVCISLGEKGAMLVSKNGIQKMPAIKVPVCGLQGAGDAMVAGICKALWDKKEQMILPYALVSAASSVMLEGTQMGTLDTFQTLLNQIMNP